MMKRLFPYLAALALILMPDVGWGLDLTILHVNDSHSYLESTADKLLLDEQKTYVRLGAWPRLASAIHHVRRERDNVALLHAGDAVQGGLYFIQYNGNPEMRFLNRLDFDAMTLGNHEFDRGADFLANMIECAGMPVLGANIDAPGVPRLNEKVKPYTVLSFEGEQVGIIGLTLKETDQVSSPGPGVTFADEAETARRYVKKLQSMDIDKIILLTHVGLERDKRLAATVPGVDIIVGGHSHTLLGDENALQALGKHGQAPYPVVVKGVDGNDVYVVQAWKWGRVLGRIDLTFDSSGQITHAAGHPLMLVADDFKRKDGNGHKTALRGTARQAVLDTLADNPAARVMAEDRSSAAFLAPFTQGVSQLHAKIIGEAKAPLPHVRAPGETTLGRTMLHGSLLAPLVARSMLEKIDRTGTNAEIAILNGGAVRDSLKQGPISIGTAYTLMPFRNTLYTMDISGSMLKDVLEQGVTRSGGAFPYLAGARYVADMNRVEGDRITSVEVQSGNAWQPLEAERVYHVVVSSYLANGGDGYAMFTKASRRYDTGFVDTEAFIEFVQAHKTLSPPKNTGVTYIPVN